MFWQLALFIFLLLSIIAAWWVWPFTAYLRARRRTATLPLSASLMLQFSLLSGLWGALQLGAFGGLLGLMFPPYWLLSATLYLDLAQSLNLPLAATKTTWLVTGGISATLIAIGVTKKARDLAHVAIALPIATATLLSLWIMDNAIQTRMAARGSEIGATCLKTRSLRSSIRAYIYSPWAPSHAIAVVDGEFMAWSYRQNDFYPIDLGVSPKTKTDCPAFP